MSDRWIGRLARQRTLWVPPTVLRRTAEATIHERRALHVFVAVAGFFNDGVVPPVIADVVLISEWPDDDTTIVPHTSQSPQALI